MGISLQNIHQRNIENRRKKTEKKMLVIFVVTILVSTNALELVPPTNTWVRNDESNVTLVCTASDKIRSCSWSTPYGKTYPLETGLMAEGGRLLHFTKDKDRECGVLITNIEEKDNGRWKCNVGVVENSEVSTASGMANITIATAPDNILLENPFHQLSTNFTFGSVHDVKCVVKNAKPAPEYSWMIGDEEVVGEVRDQEVFVDTSGLSVFTQTLKYKPSLKHANKTLRCVVSHPGLAKEVSASTEVHLVGDDNAPLAAAGLAPGGVAGVVVAGIVVLALAGISLLVLRGKFSGYEKKEKLDEEKGANEEDADKTSQTESAHDESKHDTKKTFQSKITTFFTAMKYKGKREDDVVATEWEKVDLSVAHKKEPEDEKTDEEKETETDKIKTQSLGGKISFFLTKFKRSGGKPSKQENDVHVDEKISDEVTEELKELEPEEKEEKIGEEKEKRIGSETPV